MNSLVLDWIEFCSGSKQFDKDHFFALFSNHSSDEELNEVFSYIPESEDLRQNLFKVMSCGSIENGPYLLPTAHAVYDKKELVDLAVNDLKEMRRLCIDAGEGEIAEIIDNAQPRFSSNQDEYDYLLQADIPHFWLYETIGDHIAEHMKHDGKVIDAFLEALYGLTADYYLVWYITAPLCALDVSFENYYELWAKGGDYLLTNDEIVVFRANTMKAKDSEA